MDIIGRKKIWFAISLLVMIPGLISLALFGLNLSIEFTGGSRMSVSFSSEVTNEQKDFLRNTLEEKNIKVSSIETSSKLAIVRTEEIDQRQNSEFVKDLGAKYKDAKQQEFSTIGPTIGGETTRNAIKAVLVASLLVVIYISWVFRKVPKPASSIRFGVSTIIALVHDVLVVVGVFSILGHFLHVEIDSLFVTALLTVIGFSVHDTIVVFDRMRENLEKNGGGNFAKVANDSIVQTIGRSLNNSITVLLVLFALLLFGGESIRWFVVALFIGMISGTYSSIFNATPILVAWHEWSLKRSRSKI
ncbi:MAG: protein translocase subunit SecF [Candidatus Levybacteria bacterium]|nr:protein translocase subunit SecF [Candidatus Levybacteria bacterium]